MVSRQILAKKSHVDTGNEVRAYFYSKMAGINLFNVLGLPVLS